MRPDPKLPRRIVLEGVRLAAAGLFTAAVLLFWGWVFSPEPIHELPDFDPAAIAAAETLRDTALDTASPPRIQQAVDYNQAPEAAWFPRIEPPVIVPLVEEGALPPVAERTGPQPVVLRGIDGTAQHGGTWIMDFSSIWDLRRMRDMFGAPTLVRMSPQGYPVVPHVAREYTVSEDLRTFTFHLRRGMRWSDGHPFTADDILYWWEQEAQVPEAGVHGEIPRLMRIQGEPGNIEKIDDYTVRITFPHPHSLFIDFLASYEGISFCDSPAHYRKQFHPDVGDPEKIAAMMDQFNLPTSRDLYGRIRRHDNPDHPRLWPWVIRRYRANPPYTFVRNPYYFAVDPEGRQLPYFDRVLIRVKSPDLIPIAAASGEMTIQTQFLGFENYTLFMSQREDYGFDVHHWLSTGSSPFVVHFNLNRKIEPSRPQTRWKHEFLNRKEFRQALSLAINREAIIESQFLGIGEPAQAGPSPSSPFYYPPLLEAYTDHDPERAGRILDSLGLDQRDAEGYRTFPDGSRMHFFISVVNGPTIAITQLVAEDWHDIGVRVDVRARSRQLFYTELEGMQHDMSIWGGAESHNTPLDPRIYLPSNWDSDFARAWNKWYMRGGLYGDPRADTLQTPPPPRDHPIYESILLYEQIKTAPTLERRVELMHEIFDITRENLWTVSVTTLGPSLAIVREGVLNVPARALVGWMLLSPANLGLETFALEDPQDSAGAIAQIQQDLQEVTSWPAIAENESAGAGALAGRIVQVLLWTALVLGLVLLAVRHPFVGRRIVILVPTMAIIAVCCFLIIQIPPGDYLSSRIIQLQESGTSVNMEEIDDLKKLFWLDEPAWEKFLRWTGLTWFVTFEGKDKGLLQGYLGRSMETLDAVNDTVGDRMLLTIAISFGSILFTWAAAIPIGIYSAVRKYTVSDYFITVLGFFGMSVPGFLLAIILMYLSSEYFGISVSGLFSAEYAGQPEWTWGKLVDLLQHIWVPVVILGIGGTAALIRVMRGNLLDELNRPYVTTARAKGVRPIRLLFKYPVRLALNPFVSGIGYIFPQLVSGGAIVALVLSLPTIGPLLLDALMAEDLYMAASLLVVLSLLGVIGTLVSDLLLLLLDPRIRYEGGSR